MSRNRTVLALLLAALLLALLASFCLGASSVTLPALLRALNHVCRTVRLLGVYNK